MEASAPVSTLPMPPLELARRVGPLDRDDPFGQYERIGAGIRREIHELLGADWDWSGKRMLDLGCGAGRVLRHLVGEVEAGAEIEGCDLDTDSIAWAAENISPPFTVFVNEPDRPLPRDDGSYDLILAASVFTHIDEGWSEWLLEMHRLLSPGGLLIASFLGEAMSQWIAGEPWEEDRVGMNPIAAALTTAVAGGDPETPADDWETIHVLHSPWWIRAHWGRAFEIVKLKESGFGLPPGQGHGSVLLRRRDVSVTPEELERPEPDEPREALSMRHNVAQLMRLAQDDPTRRELKVVQEERDHLRWVVNEQRSSVSWRLTRPLRALASFVRRGSS